MSKTPSATGFGSSLLPSTPAPWQLGIHAGFLQPWCVSNSGITSPNATKTLQGQGSKLSAN
jgi:hypothetical protein